MTNSNTLFKRNIALLVLAYGLVLFSYPFLRSTTTAFFLESFGAKASPKAWLLSILALTLAVSVFNQIQKKAGVKVTVAIIGAISLVLFPIGLNYVHDYAWVNYALYIWKEIYIVLLIHKIFAFCNAYMTIEQIKKFYGPIGAVGSIGGILGGQLTSIMLKKWHLGMAYPHNLGMLAIVLSCIIFFLVKVEDKTVLGQNEKISPLASIKPVRHYVYLIAAIIALSQFCINIADLNFNLSLDQTLTNTIDKTSYMGEIYSYINMITLAIQFLLIPLLLRFVSNNKTLYSIPFVFFIAHILGLMVTSDLWVIAAIFMTFKSVDYSIFVYSKEILYHPLQAEQKYGAKYLTDMISYRASKAAIAFFLIYFQSPAVLNTLMFIFLLLWLIALYLLFKQKHSLNQ
jgi:AAA family ATP:ADP antiporter